VNRQTGQPAPFQFCKQVQWKTWEHGIVINPLVSSILSKQTGHVGNSIRSGVGGGNGFRVFETEEEEAATGISIVGCVGFLKVIFLTNTIWHV
jgi:hypothetical protein